jgi:hypothetical protein
VSIFTCCNPPVVSNVLTTQVNGIAPAGQTTIMDTLDLTKYDSVQWNIVIVDPSQNKRRIQVVFATHEGNTTPFHNDIARVGSRKQDFDYTLDVDINLGSFRLKIINNSAEDYIFQITRVPVEIFVP